MKGSTPPQIAEIIIKLVKDMAAVSNGPSNPEHHFHLNMQLFSCMFMNNIMYNLALLNLISCRCVLMLLQKWSFII